VKMFGWLLDVHRCQRGSGG